jgi:chromosome segregation ATPase
MMLTKKMRLVAGGLIAVMLAGTACRTTYYAAWEKLGKHKRDLLRDNVRAAREDQKAATEEFQDALTRLKQLYGFQGGKLEETYNKLKSEFDQCEQKANAVRARIVKVEQIAKDLFSEWERELSSIANERLRSHSQANLDSTRRKYESLQAAMKRAEKSMDPVLTQFRDQVLYLKHNLNAQAIGALKTESQDIEREIKQLIEEMNRSIAEANRFIDTMPKDG